MDSTTSIAHNHINDDEIDLIEIFKTLWKSKRLIIAITFIFILFSLIYALMAPKQYKATASFFIASENASMSQLSGYASLLGVSSSSNMEGLIISVINSKSIKQKIAQNYKQRYKNDIDIFLKNQKHLGSNVDALVESFLISVIGLKDNFSHNTNKNGLITLSFVSTEKDLTVLILNDYLDNIIEYNENLELSAEKNIIKIIDAPQLPIFPYKPNKKIIVIVGFILGGFCSVAFVLLRNAFTSN